MSETSIERRLVKSPPELWQELSDPGSLAKHLGEFGEIRITRVTPESEVVWEGERASGSIEISGAGWGTKVTLTARLRAEEPEPLLHEQAPEDATSPPEGPTSPEQAPKPSDARWDDREPVTFQFPAARYADGQVERRGAEATAPAVDQAQPASVAEPEPEPDSVTEVEPEPEPPVEPGHSGFFGRLLARRQGRGTTAFAHIPGFWSEPAEVAETPGSEPQSAEPPAAEPEAAEVADTPRSEAEGDPTAPDEARQSPQPEAEAECAPQPEAEAGEPERSPSPDPDSVLSRVLDDLGAAHHRPFSR